MLSVVGYWWLYLRGPYRRYLLWSWTFGRDLTRPTRRFQRNEPAYDAYIDAIVRQVRRERAEGNEVVLVGHSIGALQAVRAAGLLATDDPSGGEPSGSDGGITLVTLGGSWPIAPQYVGRHADRWRDDIRRILAAPALPWIDVCAWEDVLSCPDTARKMPLIAGLPVPEQAAFDYVDPELPSRWPPDFYRRNVRNFAEVHFDYLRPPRVGDGFDLYRLFVGESVRGRGAAAAPSPPSAKRPLQA